MKQRQDAWSEENDLLLAETVLRHVRDGSTQLNAFEEVGDDLNRTSAACGFRWNAVVRQQYEKALALAKKQRKQRSRSLVTESKNKKEELSLTEISTEEENPHLVLVSREEPRITMEDVIGFLRSIETSHDIKQENDRLQIELKAVTNENNELKKRIHRIDQSSLTMQEDYETMVKIMERARNLVLFDEEDSSRTSFKMDPNGNLEKVAE
jgi:prespore-specific regulator